MTDIFVIILVGKEERHIGRCLEKLAPLEPRQIIVVESQHGDRTHEIAAEMGATTVFHDYPGNQAEQFNWALDNLDVKSTWILRLDADEYLTPETIEELRLRLEVEVDDGGADSKQVLRTPIPPSVSGLTLELRRKFCGGEIRHGTNGIRQVRLFRRGKARYAETLMDERLIVGDWQRIDGVWQLNQTIKQSNNQTFETIDFPGSFYDDSLMPMSEWREKHRKYAKREAQQAVESMKSGLWVDSRKAKYYKLPPYFRAFTYFCIRYFLKGGFLDGYAGWMWNFWQGLWYRCLVDYEIGKGKRREFRVLGKLVDARGQV